MKKQERKMEEINPAPIIEGFLCFLCSKTDFRWLGCQQLSGA